MVGYKCSKAKHSRTFSEKLFEASGLDISVPKQDRKGRKGMEGREGRKAKEREGREGKDER